MPIVKEFDVDLVKPINHVANSYVGITYDKISNF